MSVSALNIIETRYHWATLARDLAILSVPDSPITGGLNSVLSTYNITGDELKTLFTIPAFKDLYTRELEAFQSQGTNAAAIYRASSFSQALTEKLFKDALDDKLEAKDKIKFLELMLKAAGLSGEQGVKVNVQNNINIPVPKMANRKLQHLE